MPKPPEVTHIHILCWSITKCTCEVSLFPLGPGVLSHLWCFVKVLQVEFTRVLANPGCSPFHSAVAPSWLSWWLLSLPLTSDLLFDPDRAHRTCRTVAPRYLRGPPTGNRCSPGACWKGSRTPSGLRPPPGLSSAQPGNPSAAALGPRGRTGSVEWGPSSGGSGCTCEHPWFYTAGHRGKTRRPVRRASFINHH